MLSAVILVAGCATSFHPRNLGDVEQGMSREQVLEILGKPESVERDGTTHYLHYSYSEGHMTVPSDGSTQVFNDPVMNNDNQQLERRLRMRKYVVILEDGKMASFNEVR